MSMRRTSPASPITQVGAIATVTIVVAACSNNSPSATPTSDRQPSPHSPITTTDADWKPVAINGDFVLTDLEVQKLIQALRAGNIQIVELHNHGLIEQPRLFFMHFWAVDAVALAKALRPAMDATNLQRA